MADDHEVRVFPVLTGVSCPLVSWTVVCDREWQRNGIADKAAAEAVAVEHRGAHAS